VTEYRSFQRARLQPFVHLDEFWNFVRVFYPSADPTIALNYRGRPITLALPHHTRQMYDIIPLLQFFHRVSHLECNIWVPGNGDRYKIIAQSLRQYIFAPPRGALTITKFLFRTYASRVVYHGKIDDSHENWYCAAFKAFFDPASRQDWMDGNLISFQIHPQRLLRRMNKARTRRQNVLHFLEAAGLNDDDIKERWDMRFTVLG
jgi:hypothetical protein